MFKVVGYIYIYINSYIESDWVVAIRPIKNKGFKPTLERVCVLKKNKETFNRRL